MTEATTTENTAAATTTTKAAAKPKAEVTKVTMKEKNPDGSDRIVDFVGKRNLNKDFKVNEDGSVTGTFDFRTGDSYSLTVAKDDPMVLQLAGHGLVQKAGDECAGVKDEAGNPDVPSMALAVESILKRLGNREAAMDDRWYAEASAGDSFSGASVVIKAIAECTGKTVEWVKAFLEKKLEDDKKAKGTLNRQKLYQSFRKPGTQTAVVIERLEREKLSSAAAAVDADAEIAAMQAAAT